MATLILSSTACTAALVSTVADLFGFTPLGIERVAGCRIRGGHGGFQRVNFRLQLGHGRLVVFHDGAFDFDFRFVVVADG